MAESTTTTSETTMKVVSVATKGYMLHFETMAGHEVVPPRRVQQPVLSAKTWAYVQSKRPLFSLVQHTDKHKCTVVRVGDSLHVCKSNDILLFVMPMVRIVNGHLSIEALIEQIPKWKSCPATHSHFEDMIDTQTGVPPKFYLPPMMVLRVANDNSKLTLDVPSVFMPLMTRWQTAMTAFLATKYPYNSPDFPSILTTSPSRTMLRVSIPKSVCVKRQAPSGAWYPCMWKDICYKEVEIEACVCAIWRHGFVLCASSVRVLYNNHDG